MINWNRPLCTVIRNPQLAVVMVCELHNPEGNPYRLCYLTYSDTGRQSPLLVNEYGKGVCGNCIDVENAPETIEAWMNVYRYPSGEIYFSNLWLTKEKAAEARSNSLDYVGTAKITYTLGDK